MPPFSVVAVASSGYQHLLAAGLVVAVLLLSAPVVSAADTGPDGYALSAADASALTMLLLARNALAEYPGQSSELERRIRCSTAIDALIGLYQLHGCRWALPALQRVRELPECPVLITGYSIDGRLKLRVEELELKNPVFDGATVCLCTLLSQTALYIEGDPRAMVELTLADGTVLAAVPIDEAHPQWEQLKRLAGTFHPPEELISGSSVAFKQFFIAKVPFAAVSAVSLVWGKYGIEVPNYMNQEGL